MKTFILSSLEKVTKNLKPVQKTTCFYGFKGSAVSFQLAFFAEKGDYTLKVTGDFDKCRTYLVKDVPIGEKQGSDKDDYYINGGKPGDYPDVLTEFSGTFTVEKDGCNAVWIEIYSGKSGKAEVKTVLSDGKEDAVNSAYVYFTKMQKHVQTLTFTNWFHCDCLATRYGVPMFSKKHFDIVKNYLCFAAAHGMNTVLTPLFTPPLDTAVGGERPTAQLVDVSYDGENYTFGFGKLKKWVDICNEAGIKKFEMSHLFTQWGAKCAPKIVADINGKTEKIFGWETKATSHEYQKFLSAFIPELIKFIDKNDLSDRVYFHVSDEPSFDHFFAYAKAEKLIKPLMDRYKHIDALSDKLFYRAGLVELPVPSITEAKRFADVKGEKWCYYCCGPNGNGYVNRFIYLPGVRTAALGPILYKFGYDAFLHWGFNFWYTQHSLAEVNPYENTTSGDKFPAGDGFMVYPGDDGKPVASIRAKLFRELTEDYDALKQYEKIFGREAAEKLLPEGLDFKTFPHNEDWLIKMRKNVYENL